MKYVAMLLSTFYTAILAALAVYVLSFIYSLPVVQCLFIAVQLWYICSASCS